MLVPRKKYPILFGLVFLIFAPILCVRLFPQDKPKNEIRILIDRSPNTLLPSQAPDTMAQKIFPLLTEMNYQVKEGSKSDEFTLIPKDQSLPELHFLMVREELSRAMLFLSDRADVLYDSLSLAKTTWIKKQGAKIIEAPGFNLSFLGFQTRDQLLKNINVRKAIQLSLPIDEWMHYKFFDWVEPIPGASISPKLTEANRLLDEAGFPKNSNGIRMNLQYLTTPVREGREMAFLVREALKKIGMHVDIFPIETSLFFKRLTRGDFQLFGSRILRNGPHEIISDFLSPHGIRNYFHYDGLPDRPFEWEEAKDQVLRDLPFIPLFSWKHAAVISDRVSSLPDTSSRLDESFRFLNSLRLK